MSLQEVFKKFDIEEDSELGLALKKLDEVYDKIEFLRKQILTLRRQYEQLKEDADLMETMLMHKFNKDTRMAQAMQEDAER